MYELFCGTHLNCLIFNWMIGIGHVFQCDAIELSFIDVRYAIVFTSLGWTDGTFQVITEADVCVSGAWRDEKTRTQQMNKNDYKILLSFVNFFTISLRR